MALGQIDPARLQGAALKRWYERSPADLEEERRAEAARRHESFFGDLRAPDPKALQERPLQLASASHPSAGEVAHAASTCITCHGRMRAPPLPLPPPFGTFPLPPGAVPSFRDIPGGHSGGRGKDDREQCDRQYEEDSDICRQAHSRTCWENAAKRMGHCSATGRTGHPELRFGGR